MSVVLVSDNLARFNETGTPSTLEIRWATLPIRESMHEDFARQYAVAFVRGKISFARCARVLKGVRENLRKNL